jgi:DNA repair protein RadD
VPGTLKELVATGNRRLMTQELWPQVCAYARDRTPDPDRARRKALAIYKDMTGTWPTREFDRTPGVADSRPVLNKIKALNIAFAHRRKQEAEARA